MRLSLVLAESALELVPEEIRRSPAVVSDARRRGVDPSRILLDRSFHHSAMGRLRDGEKRGRPDLVHVALLSVTGTPLFLDGLIEVYVHTRQDLVLELEAGTRIPKSYLRFRGLVEKLLAERPSRGLVKVRQEGLPQLVKKVISSDSVVGLSTQGVKMSLKELGEMVAAAKNPCVLVGGFPHGHFSPETLGLVDRLARIDQRPLEAHVVISRVVYEVEKALASLNR